MTRPVSLGTGVVYSDPEKVIIHFGSPQTYPEPEPRIIVTERVLK